MTCKLSLPLALPSTPGVHGFPRCPGLLLVIFPRALLLLVRQLHRPPRRAARLALLLRRQAHLLPYPSDLLLELDGLVLTAGDVMRHGQVVHGYEHVEVLRAVELFSARFRLLCEWRGCSAL